MEKTKVAVVGMGAGLGSAASLVRCLDEMHQVAVVEESRSNVMEIKAREEPPEIFPVTIERDMSYGPRRKRGKGRKYHRD